MNRILECVPNFSEGRNMESINQIAAAIASVKGVKLLHIDSGKAANRTVITFAGDPDQIVEAAFRGAHKATEVIDMTRQNGEHPRFGAMDVCPLIPVAGITMEETIVYARKLGKRIGEELGINVYSYGYAAFMKERESLSFCRSGQYEGLPAKLQKPEWKPDYGPVIFNARSGASAIGARDFLVAYNVNLDTTSVRIAKDIAGEIRESGKVWKEEEKVQPSNIRGSLKAVKAIGWYIEEFGFAQVSMNLTNINETPLHTAFESVCKRAEAYGVKVTGSEIVGMVPLKSLLDAGVYFFEKQNLSADVPYNALLKMAISSLGLSQLYEFKPDEKVIEMVLEKQNK